MIEPAVIEELIKSDESPILEFKREWYWGSTDSKENLGVEWGEFYKDISSLCNAYLEYVGHDRYLIFGVCEETRELFDINYEQIHALKDLRNFKQRVIAKLEKLLNYPPLDLEIEVIEIASKRLLVIRVPSPRRLVQLKSELTTKTRTLDAGTVLVRKGQNSDSIRVADPQDISELTEQFEKYKNMMESKSGESIQKRDRSISKTVQLYIEKNASWSIDVSFPIIEKNWNDNIVFELFKISEALGGSKFFLYLHEHASQGKTNAYIKKQNYLNSAAPLIILTESPAIKDKEKRKDNIAQIFGTNHVYFIDEFGLNFLYGDFIRSFERYNLPIFVDSLTDGMIDGHNSALTALNNWYVCPASPLMVVKGYGGIGKTTLVKQFLDNINNGDKNVGLMFIDSTEIIDSLTRAARSENKIDDLYDFYAAQNQREELVTKSFSKELLRLSVDNGSLVIVLDGLDEVIAKFGSKFDIASFISSIVGSYSDNMERGKIVVTCRDNFWRDVNHDEVVKEITLLPFNENLAEEFFRQAFPNKRAKVSRAMDMADKLALKKGIADAGEAIYIPYILDLIVYLIKHEEEFGDEDVRLVNSSKILNTHLSNDYLVGSVCGREIKKLSNYEIDTQINFLIDFSVSKPGYLSLYDVKSVFEKSNSLQVNDEFVEKLTGHPLLSCADNRLYFRYDFFYDYFRTLYLVRYLRSTDINALSDQVIEILNTYVGFDNAFSRSISDRISFNDDLLIHMLETIEVLKSRLANENVSEMPVLRGAISGVFTLLLTLKWRQQNSSGVEASTQLLQEIFLNGDILEGVHIVGLSGSDKAKPIFDFRGKTVQGSHFESYEFFWDCPTDESTRFISCSFIDLEPRSGIRITTFPHTFDPSCDVSDISIHIAKREKEVVDERAELKDRLMQFFKLFHEQSNFYPKKQDDVRARIYTGKLLPVLLKNKVVIEYKDIKKGLLKQYKISDDYRSIIKIFEQGGEASLEFERVVNMFI